MTEHRNQLEDREYDALMSAAPDLLAACEAALWWFEEGGADAFSCDEESRAYVLSMMKSLHAAIAKARGEHE